MDNNDNFILLSFGLKSNFCGNVHHFYTSAHDMSAPMLCLAASDMHCPVCGVQVQGKAQGFKVQLSRQKIIIPDEWIYSCKLCNLQRKPLTSKALYHARRLSCLLGPDNLREDLKKDFISFLNRSQYQIYHSHYMSLGEWRHGHKVPAILCTVLCDKDKSFLTNTTYYTRGTWIEAYLGYLVLEKRHDFYDIMQFMLWHLQLTWFFFAGYYLIVFWVFFAVTSPYIFFLGIFCFWFSIHVRSINFSGTMLCCSLALRMKSWTLWSLQRRLLVESKLSCGRDVAGLTFE